MEKSSDVVHWQLHAFLSAHHRIQRWMKQAEQFDPQLVPECPMNGLWGHEGALPQPSLQNSIHKSYGGGLRGEKRFDSEWAAVEAWSLHFSIE